MIRNQKSYEDARDGAQFNGMNASIRKSGNQYRDRDSFSQYGTHQQSGHTLRDNGMSYPTLSTLPLGVPSQAAAVAAATAANAPPQTSHYVQGTPLTSAVVSGTGNIHGLTPHGGIATSTPTVLSLPNQHSQGPTPASTPPAAPNDPKTTGHYPQQAASFSPLMNYPYPRMYYTATPGAPRGQNNRGLHNMSGARQMLLYQAAAIPHYAQTISMQSTPMAQNNNTVSPLVNHFPPEYSNYFVPQQTPPASQNYIPTHNYYRPTSATNMRAANQSVPLPYPNSGLPGTIMYNPGVSQVSSMQQQTQTRSQRIKERKNKLPIINPDTMKEITYDESNQNSSTNEKSEENEAKNSAIVEFAAEVGRRATEPSSNYNSTSTATSYSKKEQPPSNVNGTDKNAASYLPSTDWKPRSNSGANGVQNENANTVEPVVNSLKSSNVVSSTLQPMKMDYKRPTREETSTVGNEIDTVTKPPPAPTVWPDSTSAVTQKTSAPATVTKKIPKECETAVSSSPADSSASSPVGASPPNLTPSSDGLKAPTVTSTSVVVDDNEASKKTTKQGIQSGVVDDAVKQPQAKPSPVISQSLPVASQSSTTSSPPAQVTKSDKTSNVTPPSVKPSTSALQTSGPVSEKPSPIATSPAPFGQPFPSKSPVPGAAEKNAKDEKTNPSKAKNRGKENAESNADQAKKSAQPVQAKHHSAEAKSSANVAVVAAKTNGETADTQNTTEGKTKRNKKSSKKELINKKGSEKEGSDMDVFTEKPSSPPEKSRSNEKTTAQTNNTNATRSSKPNSSQKIIDDKDISAGEETEELVNSQNIPSPQIVPAAETDKTEQTVTESRPKKYTVEFLKKLRDEPQCKKPVKIASNLEYTLYVDQANSYSSMNRSQSGFKMNYNNNMLPDFVASRNSLSLPTRKSQGRSKNDRPAPIHVTLSLKEDVPLRHSKDAWKPARLNPDLRALSPDEKKTQELYKSVTGILNKLTPEKFETLVDRIRNLPIDKASRLRGVIDLIFEKAIDEPGFCKWYAEMCKVMQTVSVPESDSDEKQQSFRTLLINKCQTQFERDKAEELDVIKKQEEINACTDPEKKKELQLLFEETERKVRRKSVGNCRFIGELFKLQMLTAKIMLRCITKLLSSTDEESLECLCKLLTTIGKDLESKLGNNNNSRKELDSYFEKMRDLSENKSYKVSSRIRFMLQDVIDLRKNDWVPRREADNPKKIEQINTELERKEQEIKMMNLQPPRRPDDFYNRNRDFKKGTRTGSQNEEEWKTVKNYKASYKVDMNKFSAIQAPSQDLTSESFGGANSFKKWSVGVGTNKGGEKKISPYTSFSLDKAQLPGSNNNFRNLSNKVTPSSSMEKPRMYQSRDDEGKISRSGSAQNIHPPSRESSLPRQPPSRNASQSARQSSQAMLSEDQLRRACSTIYQEYDTNRDLKDSSEAFEERFNPKQIPDAVQTMLSHMIENKPKAAASCGVLLANLMKRGTITKQHFIDALRFLLDISEDLIIDCPKLWFFLADTTNPLLAEDCLQISELQTLFPGSPLLEHVSAKPASKGRQAEDRDSILKKYLIDCLNEDNSDKIIEWIDANFENSRNNPSLVYTMTTIVCHIIYDQREDKSSQKVDEYIIEEVMKKYNKFFKIYIENKGELEMQCLMAVLDFVIKWEYPPGFILKLFELLYDNKLISYDSYMQWKNSDVNKHRIGVAMKTLFTFFNFIEEGNEGSSVVC